MTQLGYPPYCCIAEINSNFTKVITLGSNDTTKCISSLALLVTNYSRIMVMIVQITLFLFNSNEDMIEMFLQIR